MGRIIAIDFDGTLCRNAWPDIGTANIDVIRRAMAEQAAGARLILWTCREGAMLNAALDFCGGYGLHFDAVNNNLPEVCAMFGNDSRKIWADEYWDDKAASLEEKSCENCGARRETGKVNKRRLYMWCANTCKNYRP